MSAAASALPALPTAPIGDVDAAPDGEPAQRLRLILVREDGDWSAFADLEAAIYRAGAALARHAACRLPRASEASIVLATDALLTRLNRAYRDTSSATNVLSFPYQRPAGAADEGYLGDILLAAETIHCEAVARGIAPDAHLQHLVVHGLLHLLGWDHHSDAEAAAMEALETAILAGIGVTDPHGASPA